MTLAVAEHTEHAQTSPSFVPVDTIPDAIRDAYGFGINTVIQPLPGGHVNDTLLITQGGAHSILQKVSDVLDPRSFANANVVSRHMAEMGWEVPSFVPTVNNELHARDETGAIWRQQNYISSDGSVPQPKDYTHGLLASAGDLLGRWHVATAELDYKPAYGIPHFHDTDHYANQLGKYETQLASDRLKFLANTLLSDHDAAPKIDDSSSQLIHGDPKLENMLFRGGKPFTLIDFDTLMHGSSWLDVGDMLRSVIARRHTRDLPVRRELLESAISTYRNATQHSEDLEASFGQAMKATGRIALELGIRYLCDTVDGANYFSWDSEQSASREDSHGKRAALQLQVSRTALGWAS